MDFYCVNFFLFKVHGSKNKPPADSRVIFSLLLRTSSSAVESETNKRTENLQKSSSGPLSFPRQRNRRTCACVSLLIRASQLVNCLADMGRGGRGEGGRLIHDREPQVWRVSTDKTARVINRKREGWWEREREGREVPRRINVIKVSQDAIMTSKRKEKMESWCVGGGR